MSIVDYVCMIVHTCPFIHFCSLLWARRERRGAVRPLPAHGMFRRLAKQHNVVSAVLLMTTNNRSYHDVVCSPRFEYITYVQSPYMPEYDIKREHDSNVFHNV